MDSLCKKCGSPLFGRKGKLYCSTKCKSDYLNFKCKLSSDDYLYENINSIELVEVISRLLIEYNNIFSVVNRLAHLPTLVQHIKNSTNFLNIDCKLSNRLYHIINNCDVGHCKECGRETEFVGFKEGYREFCSRSCLAKGTIKQRETACILNYGVKNTSQADCIKNKKKQTLFKNFGVTNVMASPILTEKIKATNLNKYGTEFGISSRIVRDKIEQTNIDKYGYKSALSNEKIKESIKKTNIDKYGVSNPTKNSNVSSKISKTRKINYFDSLVERCDNKIIPLFSFIDYRGVCSSNKYKWKCRYCSNIFEDHLDDGRVPRCYNCYPRHTKLLICENEIVDFLKTLGIAKIVKGNRSIISPYELDIYLPDYSLAIEFNGLYWHSELRGKKNKNYHLDKTKLCYEKGIQLIHIFEDEWINKAKIVKSIIKSKIGVSNKINVETCSIKEVVHKEAAKFILDNYIFSVPIIDKSIGLFHNTDLIYLVCIYNNNVYFCPKVNISVVNGIDELVTYITNYISSDTKYNICVNKLYFTGTTLMSSRWMLKEETEPDYFYFHPNKDYREDKSLYTMEKLKTKFPEHYSDDLTEWQIMQLVGYDRIWDCGNLIFEYKV